MNFDLAGFKPNYDNSKPQYYQEDLLVSYKEFFEQSHILEEI